VCCRPQVPLDGTIVYGEAQVSMQHITGEAMPSRKGKGDAVPAGAPTD
jgi:Zn2+/Cd2+-exporting ATPase